MLPSDPLPKAEERRLATAAADGDSESVGRLYDAYERRLFGYCSRIVGNPDDAADATQEAFCNVIQRLPGLDTTNLNFGAYVFTAARNACMDILKAQGRFQAVDEIPEDPFAVSSIETDPERALLTEDQQRAAREANAMLPEKQRTVLAMREVAELSYDDIAAAMKMNQNSVAQLISRARLNFQKQLRTGSVVIAPTGPDDERALALTAAKLDGQIADDDLAWLNAHLSQSDASRINSEAMQESAVLYRGIGAVVVLAGLREATMARAAELSAGGPAEPESSETGAGQYGDQPTEVMTAAQSAAGPPTGQDVGENEGGQRVRRRGVYVAVAAAVLLLGVLFAAISDGEPGSDVLSETTRPTASTGATGEPRSGKAPQKNKSAVQAEPSNSQANAGTPQKSVAGDTKSPKKQNDDEDREQNPSSSAPPSDPDPAPPATSDPTPNPPPGGGGGGGIPGGPGNICAQPPCTPPQPIP